MLKGVDLSHHNHSVDFNKMKDGGISFVFLKATEGAAYIDPTYQKRREAVRAAGILFGSYHFFRPAISAEKQADIFLKTVLPTAVDDLPCVFDWEARDPIPRNEQIPKALQWLDRVERATGRVPIIYCGPSFMNEVIQPGKAFERFPLWIANYKTKAPKIPAPWKTWQFWQDAEDGTAPGVDGHCDTDFFNGSIEQLKSL